MKLLDLKTGNTESLGALSAAPKSAPDGARYALHIERRGRIVFTFDSALGWLNRRLNVALVEV